MERPCLPSSTFRASSPPRAPCSSCRALQWPARSAQRAARSVEHGRIAGLFAVLGLETGLLPHVLASAAGLGAILASAGSMLTAIKVAGAGFLTYLGAAEIRHGSGMIRQAKQRRPTKTQLFRGPVVVDLRNPKTALFVLAFLPQFAEPARAPWPAEPRTRALPRGAVRSSATGPAHSSREVCRARLAVLARSRTMLNRTTGCIYISRRPRSPHLTGSPHLTAHSPSSPR